MAPSKPAAATKPAKDAPAPAVKPAPVAPAPAVKPAPAPVVPSKPKDSPAASSCPHVLGYKVVPDKRQKGDNYKEVDSEDVAEIAKKCSQHHRCKGFTKDGKLKTAVDELEASKGSCMYIKLKESEVQGGGFLVQVSPEERAKLTKEWCAAGAGKPPVDKDKCNDGFVVRVTPEEKAKLMKIWCKK